MKNVFFAAMLLMIFSITARAQTQTARADVREGAQRARIHDGRQDGDLTRGEAHLLNKEQRHIRRTERRMKADGDVTRREKARLERKQDRANRHIRRTKHNGIEQQS
ncbi:MAG TPA: hypothetical protein VFW11_08215 [Cyclobacteriaceae bacterium]|nr:hypothetical protein [Cyclobacteriaceae bacterium]